MRLSLRRAAHVDVAGSAKWEIRVRSVENQIATSGLYPSDSRAGTAEKSTTIPSASVGWVIVMSRKKV
jgi:hypothetical protein